VKARVCGFEDEKGMRIPGCIIRNNYDGRFLEWRGIDSIGPKEADENIDPDGPFIVHRQSHAEKIIENKEEPMEYPKREPLESELYENLIKLLHERYQGMFEVKGEDEGDALVKKLYLAPQEGCVPEEFVGEELLYAIKSKYYDFTSVIRDKFQADYLQQKDLRNFWPLIYIDPSYEDETYVLVTFEAVVLYRHASKPWNFYWPSVEALQKEMADWYYEMRDRFNQYFLEGIRFGKNK
jgi:hypothetical protein